MAWELPSLSDILAEIQGTPDMGGIEGWYFSQRKNENIKLDSDITDYYIEDNTSRQDNISIKPVTFTLTGLVAEKSMESTEGTLAEMSGFSNLTNSLGGVTSLLPPIPLNVLTNIVVQAQARLQQFESQVLGALSGLNKLKNLITGEKEEKTPTAQETAFQFFYSAWQARTLFRVETPYSVFKNCAITNISFKQPENTVSYSELSISFKVMRFASTTQSEATVASRLGDTLSEATNVKQGTLSGSGGDSITNANYKSREIL